MRWAFETYATGTWGVQQLADELASRGLASTHHHGKPLSPSNVAEMLANPYYTGVVVFNGNRYPGRHEPLVDVVLFDKVQVMLKLRRSGEKQRTHRRYLTSTLYCGHCGERLCFSRNRGHGGTYDYWLCLGRQKRRPQSAACPQRYVPDDRIEDAVVRYWQRVRATDEYVCEVAAGITEHLALLRDGGGDKIGEQRRIIAKLRGQEKELLALRYAESISRELFQDEQHRIATSIALAESEIERLERTTDDYEGTYAMAADLLRNFPEMYAGASPSVRRQLNRFIFDAIYIQDTTVTGARLSRAGAILLGVPRAWGEPPASEGDDGPEGDPGDNDPIPLVSPLGQGSREPVLVGAEGGR